MNLEIPTFLLHKVKNPTLPYEVKLKNGSADFKNILHTYYLGQKITFIIYKVFTKMSRLYFLLHK